MSHGTNLSAINPCPLNVTSPVSLLRVHPSGYSPLNLPGTITDLIPSSTNG